VVEHGLFIDLADVVLFGKGSEVLELRRKPHSEPSEARRSAVRPLLPS
jgi:hypothetical protein